MEDGGLQNDWSLGLVPKQLASILVNLELDPSEGTRCEGVSLYGPKCLSPAQPGPFVFYVTMPSPAHSILGPARCSLSDRTPAWPVHTVID